MIRAAILALALTACASNEVPPSAAATIGVYATSQAACVPDASIDASEAEVDECVCAVRARYGRFCDGGKP